MSIFVLGYKMTLLEKQARLQIRKWNLEARMDTDTMLNKKAARGRRYSWSCQQCAVRSEQQPRILLLLLLEWYGFLVVAVKSIPVRAALHAHGARSRSTQDYKNIISKRYITHLFVVFQNNSRCSTLSQASV